MLIMKHIQTERIRRRVFDIIQIGVRTDRLSRGFDYFITAAIFINVLSLFLETFEACRPYQSILIAGEDLTVAVFCVEYALRIWTADLLYPEIGKRRAVLRFLFSFSAERSSGVSSFMRISSPTTCFSRSMSARSNLL